MHLISPDAHFFCRLPSKIQVDLPSPRLFHICLMVSSSSSAFAEIRQAIKVVVYRQAFFVSNALLHGKP